MIVVTKMMLTWRTNGSKNKELWWWLEELTALPVRQGVHVSPQSAAHYCLIPWNCELPEDRHDSVLWTTVSPGFSLDPGTCSCSWREGHGRQRKDGKRIKQKVEGRLQAKSFFKDTTRCCPSPLFHVSQQYLPWPTHLSITCHSLTRHHAQSQSWFPLSSFSLLPRRSKFQPCYLLSCMPLHKFLISLSQVINPVKHGGLKYSLSLLTLPNILL